MIGKERIRELISRMTVREKAAEMSQLWGENPDGTLMGLEQGIHRDPFLDANAGSLLGYYGAERTIRAQKMHLEKNRHKIPLLFMTDVIHGFKTAFPSVLGLAATWNPKLAEQTAAVAAAEAASSGVCVTFSPMADLVRDARWGRVTESAGEDPYLNALFAAAFVRGYQGDDVSAPGKIASCVKHFAGYGAAEGGRDYDSVQIGEASLWNDYLPPFLAAMEAGCKLLMPAFHTMDGVPCTASRELLTGLLRDRLGFTGTVISDCTAVWELICHGVCADEKEAALAAVGAGVDIEMVSSSFYDNLESLLAEGKLTMEQLDDAVERILTLKDELGLFENPYKDADPEAEQKLLLCPAHRQLAREAAANSAVLLKNEGGVLPLRPSDKIALIGPLSHSRKLIDTWGLVNSDEKDCVTMKQALLGCGQLSGVLHAPGCCLKNDCEPDAVYPDDAPLMEEALALAEECDKIVLVLGEHPDMSGESGSRSHIDLPDNQMELLSRLSQAGKPIVTVVLAGRPLALTRASQLSDALLYAWYPGTEGGNGIADVLTGKTGPSGRLPMSFPRSSGQCPIYYNHLPTGRPNRSGAYERFKNGYVDQPPGPLYPFGYGLTYTRFSYSPVRLSARQIPFPSQGAQAGGDALLTAEVTLKNEGSRPGTETVQLYLQDVAAQRSRPVRLLKGFSRETLAPGESRTVRFSVTADMLTYYLPGSGHVLEPGAFRAFIGPDSETRSFAEFFLLQEGGDENGM